jgi:hypothetical protein
LFDSILGAAARTAGQENEMYILLFLSVVLMSALAVRWFFFWSFPDIPEDVGLEREGESNPSVFFDPRTWAMFQPRPLISYRRDRRGRFRKMP